MRVQCATVVPPCSSFADTLISVSVDSVEPDITYVGCRHALRHQRIIGPAEAFTPEISSINSEPEDRKRIRILPAVPTGLRARKYDDMRSCIVVRVSPNPAPTAAPPGGCQVFETVSMLR